MTPRVGSAKTPGSSVSVGTGSTLVADSSGDRQTIVIGNDHASNIVYLSLGAAAEVNKGIRLNAAGGTVILDNYSGAIYAVATGTSTNVIFVEY